MRNERRHKVPNGGAALSPAKAKEMVEGDLRARPPRRPTTTVEAAEAPGGGMCIPIESDVDIVSARKMGRELAGEMGFSSSDATLIATAISELARNIVLYAKRGEVILRQAAQKDARGVVIIARDEGPGIADVRRALQDGYSTSRSLGLGLPGVRRLMDEFEIESAVDHGTTVTVKKWRR